MLKKLIAAIRGVMEDAYYGDIEKAWRKQIIDLADYEAGFEVRSLQNVVANFEFALPTENQIMTAAFVNPLSIEGVNGGQLLEPFYRDWTGKEVTRVTGAIRSGFSQGQTTQQILKTLSDHTMRIGRHNMSTVVRTGLGHASNQARQATFNRNSDIVKGVRIVATLDLKTSDICRDLDGREYPLDKGPRSPFHPNCRTIIVAIIDERFKFFEEDATRSARGPDGIEQIDAKTTYYKWIKDEPAAFQDAALGPTRGNLLRNGGLSAERFAALQLGRNFEPLTLREMEKLEPVAFAKAKIKV